jgi:hypothetical protein
MKSIIKPITVQIKPTPNQMPLLDAFFLARFWYSATILQTIPTIKTGRGNQIGISISLSLFKELRLGSEAN